jgi:hypothetical protein
MTFEIRGGGKRTEGLDGVEGHDDLLGYVEDGPDATLDETLPVAGVVL